jgi:outer membrane protein, multidrug efflux system
VSLSLPLSQTTIRSNTEAAVAAYKQAVAQLRSTARQAVREVETSLLELNATQQRGEQAKLAAQGYGAALAATQARYRAGLASLVELEDARRTALFAQQNQLTVERDRIAAWINLYRATGGGWTADKPVRIGAALTTETAATASSNAAKKMHDIQKTSPVTASLSPATPATQP